MNRIEKPEVFGLVSSRCRIDEAEMYRVFNMGMGFAVIVSRDNVDNALCSLRNDGIVCTVAGEVVSGSGEVILRS